VLSSRLNLAVADYGQPESFRGCFREERRVDCLVQALRAERTRTSRSLMKSVGVSSRRARHPCSPSETTRALTSSLVESLAKRSTSKREGASYILKNGRTFKSFAPDCLIFVKQIVHSRSVLVSPASVASAASSASHACQRKIPPNHTQTRAVILLEFDYITSASVAHDGHWKSPNSPA